MHPGKAGVGVVSISTLKSISIHCLPTEIIPLGACSWVVGFPRVYLGVGIWYSVLTKVRRYVSDKRIRSSKSYALREAHNIYSGHKLKGALIAAMIWSQAVTISA